MPKNRVGKCLFALGHSGFSLIEVAIAIFVITLLLGSILVPLSTQVEQRKTSETQKALDETKEALLGYALANGYLPCPAISATDGREDRSGSACTGAKRQGFLPWVTLGTSKLDSWGHIFRYSVTPAFSNSASLFTISTPRDISISTRNSTGTVVNLSNANDIPVVIFSVGRNGNWGTSDDGTAVGNLSATNADEVTNNNGGGTGQVYFSRTTTDNTAATGGEFDDIVVWLSTSVLLNRMVAAGKLP
jgi:prepilin-type N-terminal cleavage/methylation domain-containing protein